MFKLFFLYTEHKLIMLNNYIFSEIFLWKLNWTVDIFFGGIFSGDILTENHFSGSAKIIKGPSQIYLFLYNYCRWCFSKYFLMWSAIEPAQYILVHFKTTS